MKTMILGDVHGEWGALNALLNKKRPDIVYQAGDFGWWPHMVPESRKPIGYRLAYGARTATTGPKLPAGCQLFWCDGNHEDHWSLRKVSQNATSMGALEFWPGVTYMPRGSIMQINNGPKVMFVGGAQSIDRANRTLGQDWFPEETISMSDLAKFAPVQKVDIVISHTCPWEFDMKEGFGRENDCSRSALSHVLEAYRPDKWFFGHWHQTTAGRYMDATRGIDCAWQNVSCSGNTGWWRWL